MSGDLATDEGVWQMCYFKCAAYAVVVGYGDVIHPPRQSCLVEMPGRGVAFRAVELAHRPVGRFVGMAGVQVKVGFEGFHISPCRLGLRLLIPDEPLLHSIMCFCCNHVMFVQLSCGAFC